ncbi:hypothetical protein [Kutzneria albida]|uniref:Uncharacterized protein n=1 Tax=Kutzneria albida DSM 43870 TaxID=1449976 RepID=W5WC19_9PSEU|nr:hypothetical protein [Kutzneria albida]AHH98300.1 hypothetical protein KALB_4938 [Kutzneria albida DSM 43870]
MTPDIIAAIDQVTAPVCGWCQAELRSDGPSEYYCNDVCQYEWQRLQGVALASPIGRLTNAISIDVTLDIHGFQQAIRNAIASMATAADVASRGLLGLLTEKPMNHNEVDARAHALELHRNRNTGPARQQRAPRSINPGRRR